MKNQDHLSIIFVNSVAASGLFNNVVNLSFSAYNFTPNDAGKVDPDPVIVARMRMDKGCLMQLREVCNNLITMMDHQPDAPKEEDIVVETRETSH